MYVYWPTLYKAEFLNEAEERLAGTWPKGQRYHIWKKGKKLTNFYKKGLFALFFAFHCIVSTWQ